MGQDLALRQISDAVCDHLANKAPKKPLVLSLHGPPGVGKSFFHQLAAQALYSPRPHPDLQCPGHDCAGYKVLFGLDFTEDDRQAQHAALRNAIFKHVQSNPESLLVIEEYDKLDCHMRGFFRQLLQGNMVGNISLAKSIVVLESNTGYTKFPKLLESAKSREKISSVKAQQLLKDLVYLRWLSEKCEETADTLKMVSLVDFFLPFFPLERVHIEELFQKRIQYKINSMKSQRVIPKDCRIEWNKEVIDFLTNKVEFNGLYPIEGGKEVATMMSRYVSRPLRHLVDSSNSSTARVCGDHKGAAQIAVDVENDKLHIQT